jgi:hypothetical protein
MKKKAGPLQISRETLQALQAPHLAKLGGGASDPNFCGTQVDTCFCVSCRICFPPLTQ